MRMLVLRALLAAGLADLCTELADLPGEFTASRHVGSGHPADGGAIDIERDAPRHHLDVVFLQASGRAVIAGVGAIVAGTDAACELFLSHGQALRAWSGNRRKAHTRTAFAFVPAFAMAVENGEASRLVASGIAATHRLQQSNPSVSTATSTGATLCEWRLMLNEQNHELPFIRSHSVARLPGSVPTERRLARVI